MTPVVESVYESSRTIYELHRASPFAAIGKMTSSANRRAISIGSREKRNDDGSAAGATVNFACGWTGPNESDLRGVNGV